MAGLKRENLPPAKASMGAHVLAASEEADGLWAPVGGARALGKALEAVVEEGGGGS
jgi:phytoene dehydrogenase-like protein